MSKSKDLLFTLHCINRAKSHVDTLKTHIFASCKSHAMLAEDYQFQEIIEDTNTLHGKLSALSLHYQEKLQSSYRPEKEKPL